MSKVIDYEIIELDGSDPAETIKGLDRDKLATSNNGRPTRAVITVHGAGVYVNRNGEDPVIAEGNYQFYGAEGTIISKGYDDMVGLKIAQLDGLTSTLYVVYEN
jgi:hypothetical protein